jgi:hypothetical protein
MGTCTQCWFCTPPELDGVPGDGVAAGGGHVRLAGWPAVAGTSGVVDTMAVF